MPSTVLVIEPKRDPEIEEALSRLDFEVRFANKSSQALKFVKTLSPEVIVLNMLISEPDPWSLISRIRDLTKKRSHPPILILLTNCVLTWEAADLGPVRLSDRRSLRATFREALENVKSGLAEETEWRSTLDKVSHRGTSRFKAEQFRMRGLGILDSRNRPLGKEWPPDMKPNSKTGV